jgi:hypothetical protein
MATEKKAEIRDFNFEDSTLEQLADFTYNNVERDLTELAPRGVTQTTLDNFRVLIDDFKDYPTDEEFVGKITIAVGVKNTAKDEALTLSRTLRTAVENTYVEQPDMISLFKFEGLNKLDEDQLPRAMRKFHRLGVEYQAGLAAEGITVQWLVDYRKAVDLLDDELDNVEKAEEVRDKSAQVRIEKANKVYREVVRLTNIGKDYFFSRDEAYYNDYVIDNFIGGSKPPVTRTGNVAANNQLNVDIAGVTIRSFWEITLTTQPTSQAGAVLQLAFRNAPDAPFDASLNYLTATLGETARISAGEIGYNEANGNVFLLLYNNTTSQAAFKISIAQ